MSTWLGDFKNNVYLHCGVNLTAGTTGNTAGTSGDFIQADLNCFAIQTVGTVGGTSPSVTGKIQESTDGTTWTDVVTEGVTAAFTAQTAASTLPQALNFQRRHRFLRGFTTITGTGTLAVPVSIIIGEQIKKI